MNHHRLPHVFLVVSLILAAATTSGADPRWSRLTPEGAGFSIDVPGEQLPSQAAGEYGYNAGLWFFSIRHTAVEPAVRHLVETGDRRALRTRLESMRDVMVASVKATCDRSSFTEIDGFQALRFRLANEDLEGTNLLVITGDQVYMVMTVGPKGAPDDNAKRFLRSFRLAANGAE